MKPGAWRAVLLVLCAITAIFAVIDLVDSTGFGGVPPWRGRAGFTSAPSSQGGLFYLRVLSIDPGGPADRAGLRAGDIIDVRQNTFAERAMIFGPALNGRPVTLHVRRDSTSTSITVTAASDSSRLWIGALNDVGVVWIALFAGLIAWRRSYVPEMRLLCLTLIFYGLGNASYWATPWPWMFGVASLPFGLLSVAFLAACAGRFGAMRSTLGRIVLWLCYALVGIAIAIFCARTLGIVTLQFDAVGVVARALGVPFAVVIASFTWLAILAALLCTVLAVASSRGAERQRAAWSLVPPALLILFGRAAITAQFFAPSYALVISLDFVSNVVVFLTPLILAYVALNRRLLDIGFALNRTAVFAIVSTIVIGVFVLVEWAASAWLVNASHTTSVIAGMIVALALGLSMRFIHRFVDEFVGRVFFRKRREDEAAIRIFGHEAAYITDRSVLLERALQEVREHTDADDASILVLDGGAYAATANTNGSGATLSENDAAIVALRAWHKPVDLHKFGQSQLRGEFAFPMVSRGTLFGILICGPKRDGEAYAPDESAALLELARGVGTALGTLSNKGDNSLESLVSVQSALLTKILERQELLIEKLDAESPRMQQPE